MAKSQQLKAAEAEGKTIITLTQAFFDASADWRENQEKHGANFDVTKRGAHWQGLTVTPQQALDLLDYAQAKAGTVTDGQGSEDAITTAKNVRVFKSAVKRLERELVVAKILEYEETEDAASVPDDGSLPEPQIGEKKSKSKEPEAQAA